MAILERVAVHQTRLRVPGIALDARGIALGARGLVLLPSLDRLVAFLSVYSEGHALEPLLGSLRIEVLESRLGTREIALGFDAGSSDRLDAIAEVARLLGAFTFTGTSRHYVEYRNASAPFGWDATEVMPTDRDLVLYHSTFSQVYGVTRTIELSRLLIGLRPRPAYEAADPEGARLVLAEAGLGPSVARYLVRSRVPAELAVLEWPPATDFDDGPLRRWLFRLPELPARMRRLMGGTPGLAAFAPVTAGAAVELGFRYPITLRACPVFDPAGLVLFRGREQPPLIVDRVPALADVRSLARAGLDIERSEPVGTCVARPPSLEIPVRLVPDGTRPAPPRATLVPADELGLLRRLAYALPRDALERTRVAITGPGAFLLADEGVDLIPLGRFYRRIHARIHVPTGLRPSPPLDPELLFTWFGAPSDRELFYMPDGRVIGIHRDAFVRFDRALLVSERWAPLEARALDVPETEELPVLWLEPLGARPLAGVEP